jgi:hypothetical protein
VRAPSSNNVGTGVSVSTLAPMSFAAAPRRHGWANARGGPIVVDTDSQLPRGDLRLLGTDIARRLLASTVPARLGYTARDGTPRVVPTWFHWTGEELVMPTFVRAPHVARQAAGAGPRPGPCPLERAD